MYNNACNCGPNNFGVPYGNGNDCNPRLTPMFAPKQVMVTQSCRYVEQPVICPVENRHVQTLVSYPRYYPQVEQTYMVRDLTANGAANFANGNPGSVGTYGAPTQAYSSGSTTKTFGVNNSFKNGCGD